MRADAHAGPIAAPNVLAKLLAVPAVDSVQHSNLGLGGFATPHIKYRGGSAKLLAVDTWGSNLFTVPFVAFPKYNT